MTEILKQSLIVKLFALLIAIELVYSYESVYDIIERKNQRRFFDEPRNRYFETSESYRFNDGDKFSSHNRKPDSIYSSSVKPVDFDRSFQVNRKISTFGNGYDNLGNGVIDRGFDSFRGRNRFGGLDRDGLRGIDRDGLRGIDRDGLRGIDRDGLRGIDRDGLRGIDRDSFRGIDRDRYDEPYHNRRVELDLPIYEERPYHRRSHRRRYEEDYPEFYEKDYFRPKFDEKAVNYEKKGLEKNFEVASGQKGIAGLSKVDSLIANNEDKKQKKTDEGFRSSQEGSNVDVGNKEKFGETAHVDKNGENKSTIRSNKITKKGHSTKGFSSHHHKDETGNTTTFFDESSDHGGQSDFKDFNDEYGTRKVMEQINNKDDGKFFKENAGQSGNYGTGYLKDNTKYEKDILTNDNHYDKEEKFKTGEENEDIGIRRKSHYHGGGRFGYLEPDIHLDHYY